MSRAELPRHMGAKCDCGNAKTTGRRRCMGCERHRREAAAAASLPQRFERFVIRNPEGCWGWRGATTTRGYGTIHVQTKSGHKVERAHRASWLLFRGPIPDGLVVCHACDNPPCTNPDHLFLGTHADNAADRDAKGRNVNHAGEAHYLSSLTADEVRQIRAWRAAGVKGREVARRLGVSEETVSNIWRGRTWASI